MPVFFMWAYAVLVFGLLAEGISGSWELIKGFDVSFTEAHAREAEYSFDLEKARSQQVVVLRLGLPLGLMVVGAMTYHLWWSFTATTYAYLAMAWFIAAPLRRYWQILTAAQLDKKLFNLGLRNGQAFQMSAWQATKRYYARGLQLPPPSSGKKRRGLFVYRLRWVNNFAWLWRWTRYLRVAGPVFVEGLASLIWPVTAVCMVGVYCHEALELKGAVKPWWGSERIA